MYYSLLLNAHSILRTIVLLLILSVIFNAILGLIGNKPFGKAAQKLNSFTMIGTHIQLTLGLLLYFVSPWVQFAGGVMKDKFLRYWTVEHISLMLIAVVLISLGVIKSKKQETDQAKYKTTLIYIGLATLLIFAALVMSQRGVFVNATLIKM